jgi:GPH family glycoside/pentoside/hexuronide:cation symporter
MRATMPEPQSHVVAPEDRIPLRSKVVYGLGVAGDMWGHWLYVGLAYPVFNLYLKVNPLYIGLALMITRLVDAFTDPILARFSDNARTRWGRRRPFILVGSILAGLGLPMLFFVSPGWGQTHLRLGVDWMLNFHFWTWHLDLRDVAVPNYFWFILGSAMLYAPMMSCYNMPYYSLGAELTPDYHERTNLMSFRGMIQKILEVPNFYAFAFTQTTLFAVGIDAATGHMTYNTLRGAQVFCAIMGAIIVVFGVLNFLFVKERYYHKVESAHQAKVTLKESFFTTLKVKPFLMIVVIGLSFNMGSAIVGQLGQYTTIFYVAGGDQQIGSKWNGHMGLAAMAGALLGVPLINVLSRSLGKRRALMGDIGFGIAAFLATWWLYNPAIPWMQLIASGAIGLCGAALWVMHGSMGADVMDYDEISSHKRREGAFSACSSWIMKASSALTMFLSGIVLNATGFDAQKAKQSAETITNIRLNFALIPAAGLAIALFAVFLYPLTRERMAEIRQQLEARRGKV